MSSAVNILQLLPEVAAIGRTKLQDYCREWLQRPIAGEYGVTHLIVGSNLMLTVNIDDAHATYVDSAVFIPIDELAGYIIDQRFTDGTQRRDLHDRLRTLRKRWGDVGYQFEVMAGRVGKLWIKCKNPLCDASLETAQKAVEGQTIQCPPCQLTCPVCGHTDVYDGNDLHLRL